MGKCRSSDKSATICKKQRKSISLEEKLDVVTRYQYTIHMTDIASAMEILKSTLRTTGKQAAIFKESCKSATTMIASKIT
jgi:hypothetical protein